MTESLPDFTWLPDLALRSLGGAVIWANDELFAEKENLVSPGPSQYRPASFGHKGQIYDGWETRRRRDAGHDTAILRLGVPGVIRVESGYCRTDYVHHASAAGKRTQRYRETRRKLGDDYTTTVTECEEVMAKIFERATRLLTK